ncbi:MAG: hypothetical protein IJS68_01825 [Clostridia bacterium]|nr:hypothetical protein [Clostridia bacterium]
MSKLLDLSRTIGWVDKGEENGVTKLEYNRRVNEYESLRHILQLRETETDADFLDALGSIIEVLPKKLKKTIFKLVKNSDLAKKEDIIDLLVFTVEEYRAQSEYQKLDEYARVLNVDLEKLGYSYCYELTKKERNEILSKIESKLPLELLPQVGKMKKIDYKIGFVKTRNAKIVKQAEDH